MTYGKTAKWISTISLSLLLAACGSDGAATDNGSDAGDFDATTDIHVITREDGSGTRAHSLKLLILLMKMATMLLHNLQPFKMEQVQSCKV